MADYDYIIVGGGTAGCVLANRLSARSECRVLLCEAGRDIRDGEAPEEILDSFSARAFLDRRFLWNDLMVTTDATPSPSSKVRRYEQARVLGGGSSINGQLANRGAPHDYDEWERRGAAGWGWSDVLPYFKKLERDLDFEGPLHGQCGPIPIRRIFPHLWAEHARAMAEGFKALGYEYLPDQNGEFRDGYYPFPIPNVYDRRVSNAIAYLGPAVRLRTNLRILTEAHVSELLFEAERCIGVRVQSGSGEVADFRGREVIVACGTIYSPAQLLRAGIGPADHLASVGIPVRAHRPGVGQRLMDHPSVSLAAFVKPHARLNGRTRRHLLVGLRFSSGMPGITPGDMALSVSTKAAWHAVGDQIASLTIWVNKTCSEAGEVRLRSPRWQDQPQVDFRLLHDRRDLERMMGAIRRLSAVFQVPAVQAVVSDPFPASFSDKVRQVGVINKRNAVLTAILAKLLDGPASFRRLLLRTLVMEGPTLDHLLADEDALEAFVRKAAVGVWHASCTCRMGAPEDPMAVTDPAGRVYGVRNLRVVDASIFPTIPSANVNLTTNMVAEKISDAILAGA